MSKTKIHFGRLIDLYYLDTQTRMFLLDWMIKTGIPHKQATGRWSVEGISQRILDYSANEHQYKFNLFSHFNHNSGRDFFTAVFARAIYSKPNKPIAEWRESERLYPDKFRYFDIDYFFPVSQWEHPYGFHNTNGLIWYLSWFLGANLKKENCHQDIIDRTCPKIVSIKLYTVGSGWIFEYTFSFKEFDYEPGWDKAIRQGEKESINQFLWRTVKEMDTLITDRHEDLRGRNRTVASAGVSPVSQRPL